MNFWLVLSWIFLLKFFPRPSLVSGLWIGLSIGFATLFRQQACMQIPAWIIWLAWEGWHESSGLRAFIKRYSGMMMGILVGVAILWGFTYLGLKAWGAWEAFKYWGISYNFTYIARGGRHPGAWLEAFKRLALLFGSTSTLWLLAISGLRSSKNLKSALAYLGSALVATLPGFRFYPHYFFQAFPPLAVLAVLGWERIFRLPSRRLFRAAQVGLVVLVLVAFGQDLFLNNLLEHTSAKDYASVNRRVGEYIRERTQPGDKIFIWGWGHAIYYYSDRGIGVRLVLSDMLSGRVSGCNPSEDNFAEAQTHILPERWAIFMEDMEKNRPIYLIDTSPANIHNYRNYPLEKYPILKRYRDLHYRYETTIEDITLYRRNDSWN